MLPAPPFLLPTLPFWFNVSTPAPIPAPNKTTSHTWCVILLNDIMDLHMLSLVPSGLFYAMRCQFTEVSHVTRFFASTFLWYHSNKQRHTTHTEKTNKMIYPYKYILKPPVLGSQQLPLLHSMNNQKFTLKSSAMFWLFRNHWLVEVTYQLIGLNSINFSTWNK